MTNKIIDIKNLSFFYKNSKKDKIKVLENINFNLKEKEIVSILGFSGCGKTTLLKLIGDVFTSKDYIIEGKLKRRINLKTGYISQKARLLPWLSLIENIKVVDEILKKRGLASNNSEKKIIEYLNKMNLFNFRDYYPFQLSGGMKTRGILIRSFIYFPDIMILDEPFNNLDEITRYLIYNILLDYWKENSISLILVTHNIREALYLSDRIIVMGNKPATIIEEIKVDTKKYRGLRKHPDIAEFEQYIWEKFENGYEKII